MNYIGRKGQYFEIPEEVLKVLFDKDGNKRLHNYQLRFSDEDIAENEHIYDDAIRVLMQFDAEFAQNTEVRPSLVINKSYDPNPKGEEDSCVLNISAHDRLRSFLDNCRIPLREARRIYGIEPAVYDDSSIMGFLKNHYDLDTKVIIYDSSKHEIVNDPMSDISVSIDQALSKYGYKEYIDGGYRDKSVKIFGKQLVVSKELRRLLFEELYSLNK